MNRIPQVTTRTQLRVSSNLSSPVVGFSTTSGSVSATLMEDRNVRHVTLRLALTAIAFRSGCLSLDLVTQARQPGRGAYHRQTARSFLVLCARPL